MSRESSEPDGVTDASVANSLEISQHLLDAALPAQPMLTDVDQHAATTEPPRQIDIPKPGRDSKRRSSKQRKSLTHGKKWLRLLNLLPSRTLRVTLTCAGVVVILGLIGLNFRNRSGDDAANNEFLDIELSEFGDRPHAPDRTNPSEPFADMTQPNTGCVDQAAWNGQRGAWLTGQIEFDSPPIIPASASRPVAADRMLEASVLARGPRGSY